MSRIFPWPLQRETTSSFSIPNISITGGASSETIGVFIPGRNPVEDILNYAGVPLDLSGKSVLDIRASNGGLSFECARRGATRVVAFGPDDPDTTGFAKIKQILDLKLLSTHGDRYMT